MERGILTKPFSILLIALTLAVLGGVSSMPKHPDGRLNLSRTQEEKLYSEIEEGWRLPSAIAQPSWIIGQVVPLSLKLSPFPAGILKEFGVLNSYRYATVYRYGMITNEILVINARTREIDYVLVP
jgi:hypothetical protein